MFINKAEVRLVVIGLIYLVSILFSKFFLGGYEDVTVYIVTGVVLFYLSVEGFFKNRKKLKGKSKKKFRK